MSLCDPCYLNNLKRGIDILLIGIWTSKSTLPFISWTGKTRLSAELLSLCKEKLQAKHTEKRLIGEVIPELEKRLASVLLDSSYHIFVTSGNGIGIAHHPRLELENVS